MITGTRVTDCVTNYASNLVYEMFANRDAMMGEVKTINIIDLTNSYTIFKSKLLYAGYEFSDYSYLQIFQIVTELAIINSGVKDELAGKYYDNETMDTICDEIENCVPAGSLDDVDCDTAIIPMLYNISQELSDINVVYCGVAMPIRWVTGLNSIIVHVGITSTTPT